MLIFTHGDLDSILKVKSLLAVFYNLSGLKLNAGNSEIFATSLSDDVLETTSFRQKRLHVCYLGVPLVTRKLSFGDCEPLIKKIKDRIGHWSSRFLFYGGRLQLVQAVLFNVQVFWSRHFMFPKSVLHHIDQLCYAFYGMVRSRKSGVRELVGKASVISCQKVGYV